METKTRYEPALRRRHPDDPGLCITGRGGNRLPVGHEFRAWTPPAGPRRPDGSSTWEDFQPWVHDHRDLGYERRWLLGLDVAARRGIISADARALALWLRDTYGEFGCANPHCGAACDRCRDRLTMRVPIWPAQADMARRRWGAERYEPFVAPGEEPPHGTRARYLRGDDNGRGRCSCEPCRTVANAGARTIRTPLRQLEDAQFLTKRQRCKPQRGGARPDGYTNEYLFTIPPALHTELLEAEKARKQQTAQATRAAKAAKAGGRVTEPSPPAATNEPTPGRLYDAQEQQRRELASGAGDLTPEQHAAYMAMAEAEADTRLDKLRERVHRRRRPGGDRSPPGD